MSPDVLSKTISKLSKMMKHIFPGGSVADRLSWQTLLVGHETSAAAKNLVWRGPYGSTRENTDPLRVLVSIAMFCGLFRILLTASMNVKFRVWLLTVGASR